MSFFGSIFPKKKNAKFEGSISVDKPMFVIGDVHGCYDLTVKLVDKCPKDAQLVFVGDIIDRGPESGKALNYVKELVDAGATCIKGNHEKMMQDFLERPIDAGERWFRYGGLQTIESYGINTGGALDIDTLVRIRNELVEAMPEGMQDWVSGLPKQWKNGNVHVIHAGANPAKPMDEQSSRSLVWGHPNFFEQDREDGQWTVFGHTILDAPMHENGRIGVDTGAYATGVLTAAYIADGNVEFVTA